MIAPARWAAYTAFRAITSGRSDLPDAIARARTMVRDERDRALMAEIVTGTLRWQAALDDRIAHHARISLPRLDAEVLDILRLSVYQLLHLDRVPSRSVVDDAVELVKQAGKASARGLANAVLRSIARLRDSGALSSGTDPGPDAPRDTQLHYLSVVLSHPRWLAERWLDRFGYDSASAWMRFNNQPAPLTLRANTLKTSREELAAQLAAFGVMTNPARFASNGLIVREGNPLVTPLAGTGVFTLQDEASQLVTELAAANPGEVVLDACASPGGKTTAMAADMRGAGVIVATDMRRARLDLLRRTVESSGARNIRIAQNDLRRGLSFGARFDLVLVDAPCSGLGTVRRDPDIKWRRDAAQLPEFQRLELTILETAASGVRPGGRLVYATCSSEPEENEQIVDAFLGRHSGFRRRDPQSPSGLVPPGLAAVLDAQGQLHTYPHEHGLEAFFAVVLTRR